MAPRLRSAVVRFDALPVPVWRVLFLALPVDARARAACVCRSWRAFLADPSLWQVLDLTRSGGVVALCVKENLVLGAVARAAGRLRVLSFSDDSTQRVKEVLFEFILSDGAELEQIHTNVRLSVDTLDAVFAAAPRLQVLNTDVTDLCTALLPVLRNDPPYGPLRVRKLFVHFGREVGTAAEDADVLALAAAVAAHESLKYLSLLDADYARGLNALVNASAHRRVAELQLIECVLDAESVLALARLLQRGSLTKLDIACDDFPGGSEASAEELWAAVRSCRTLTHLELQINPPDGTDRRDIMELIDAAAALPALSVLDLSFSKIDDKAAAGHALRALLRANLPNLRTLRLHCCDLGDEGLAPLLDGLAANTHLRELDCGGTNVSEAFERGRLLPAVAELIARDNFDT